MSLICIFAKEYNIKDNPELISELEKLLFCRHIRLVFVDSNDNPGQPLINNPQDHRLVYPALLNDPTDVESIRRYIQTLHDNKPNEIRLYIAPDKPSLDNLVGNILGAGETLDTPNTIGMLCWSDRLPILIKMLQTMDFSKKYVHKILVPAETQHKFNNDNAQYELIISLEYKKLDARLKNIFIKNYKRNIHPYYNNEERIELNLIGTTNLLSEKKIDVIFQFQDFILPTSPGEKLIILLPHNLKNIQYTLTNFFLITADKQPNFTNLDPLNMPPKEAIINKAADNITSKYLEEIKSAAGKQLDTKLTKQEWKTLKTGDNLDEAEKGKNVKIMIERLEKGISFYKKQISKLKSKYSTNIAKNVVFSGLETQNLPRIRKLYIDKYVTENTDGTVSVDWNSIKNALINNNNINNAYIRTPDPNQPAIPTTKYNKLKNLIDTLNSNDPNLKTFTRLAKLFLNDDVADAFKQELNEQGENHLEEDNDITDMQDAVDSLYDILNVIKYTSRLEYYKLRLKQLEDALDAQKTKLNELENIRNFGQKTHKKTTLTNNEHEHIKYNTLKNLRAANVGNAKLQAALAEMKKLEPELNELQGKGIKCNPNKWNHRFKLREKNSTYKRACELEKKLNVLQTMRSNIEKEAEIAAEEQSRDDS